MNVGEKTKRLILIDILIGIIVLPGTVLYGVAVYLCNIDHIRLLWPYTILVSFLFWLFLIVQNHLVVITWLKGEKKSRTLFRIIIGVIITYSLFGLYVYFTLAGFRLH